jgi:hypothetical protein
MGGIFIWLSGASRKVLADCPTERPKYFGLGAIILVTGAMAGVSLAFALVNALKITLTGAIIFAFFWGLAIMMIDRLFVVSMHRQRNPLIYVVQATPRVLMSVVLGFVISTPFVLQIFKPEITNQVQQMQAAQREAYFKGLSTNPVYRAVQADQATVNQLKTQQASGGTPVVVSSDPQIKTWTQDEANANAKVQYWTAEQNCQLYGGTNSGVTCHPGYGPVAHNDQAEINYWSGQASTYSSDIASRTSTLESQDGATQAAAEKAAGAQLPAAVDTLQAATVQLDAQTKNITSSINGNDGILEQLKALGAVTAHNFTLQMARLLLFLLFLFVDIMPVFVKLLMNLAPAGIYDKVLAKEEETELQLAENSRAVRQLAHRQAVQAEAAGVRHRNSALSAALPDLHEKIVRSRQRVEEDWLKRHEAEQMRDVASGEGIAGFGSASPASGYPAWWQRPARAVHLRWPWNGGPAQDGMPPTQPGPLWHQADPGASRRSRWAWLGSFRLPRLSRLRQLLGLGQEPAGEGTVPPPEPRQPEGPGWAATAPAPGASAEPTGAHARPDPPDGFPHATTAPADGQTRRELLDAFFPRPAEPGDSQSTVTTPGMAPAGPVEPDGVGRTEELPDFGSASGLNSPGGDDTGRDGG